MKSFHRRFVAVLLAVVMTAMLLPAGATPVRAASASDGWTVATAWSTQSADYAWNATTAETRQPKLYVTYKLKGATRDYGPGDIEIRIPGIGTAVRGSLVKASSIAADKPDSEWTYTWDSVNDIYTFRNKFEIKKGGNVNGGFEFMWTLSARSDTDGFRKTGTPTLTIRDGGSIVETVDLPDLSYSFTSKRDEYRIGLSKSNLTASELERMDEGYTWYDINLNYQVSRRARGLKRSDTWVWFELPDSVSADDIIVMNGSTKVKLTVDDPDHPGQLGFYLSKGLQGDICTSSTTKSFRIGLDADDGEVIKINAHLDRLYLDEKSVVTTATTSYEKVDDSLQFSVQSYGFQHTEYTPPQYVYNYAGYRYYTEIDAPAQYNRSNAYGNYANRLNSANLYNNTTLEFKVQGKGERRYSQSIITVAVPSTAKASARVVSVPGTSTPGIGETQAWQMALGVDRISTTCLSGPIRALDNDEYDITYVRIPSRAASKDWTLYVSTDRDAPFDDYTEAASGDMKSGRTVYLPDGTKAFYILIDGIVGTYEQTLDMGVRFHLDYEKCLAEGRLPNPEGNLIAFNNMRALYVDADGNVVNDVAMANDNYLGSYGKALAEHDVETHGEYLYRDYDEIFLRESITKLSTTVSPGNFALDDSIFTSAVNSTGSISSDEPGELTKFSAFVELPAAVRIDVDAPVSITGSATDVNGKSVTGFKAHASPEIVDFNGHEMLRVDFDFTDQPLEISRPVSYTIGFNAELRYADFVIQGSQYMFKSYLMSTQGGLAKIVGDRIMTDMYDVNGDGVRTQSMATHSKSVAIYDDVSEWREHTNKYVSSQQSGGYVMETNVELRDDAMDEQPGAGYSYRLDYNVGSLTASNLVFYDRLEQGAVDRNELGEADDGDISIPSGWHGTLVSVDTSLIRKINGIPTVYYSTDPAQAFDLSAPGWTTEMPADKSSVRTVAVKVDTSRMENGVLGRGIPAYVIINMMAPSDGSAVGKTAVNQYTVDYNAHDILGNEDGEYTLVSNETYVILRKNVAKLVLGKADADNVIGVEDDGSPKYASLYGGKFAVYDSDDPNAEPIWTGSLNSLGQIVIDPAEYGVYYWEEIEAPVGYEKSEGRHEVKLDGTTNGKVQYMLNDRLPGSVVLTKDDGNYAGYGPLAGAEFELYTNNGDPVMTNEKYEYDPNGGVDRFVTGPDGTLTIDGLPWGSYYFLETAAPEGYDLSSAKVSFTIGMSQYDSDRDEIRVAVSAKNAEQTASVRLVKKDAVDGDFVDGAMFSLYRKARSDSEIDVEVKSGLRTDTVGEIQVDGLPFGEYYFLETRNADGYKMPEGDAAKTGVAILDKTTVDQVLEIEFRNERRTGEVELLKMDDFDQCVEGATYGLYRDGVEIDEYVTDDRGIIAASGLEWGEYYFLEKSAPEGYAISDEKIEFEITRENVSNVVYLTATDERARGSVQIVKTDAGDSGKLLSGAVFELYANDGTRQVPGVDYTTDREDNIIITGEDGTVTIRDIRQGGYYLVETESPEGYSLDDKYVRFSVTLGNARIVQVLSVENQKGKASIKINKVINDAYEEFGNPTFLFTITDDTGRKYTASIKLGPDQYEGSTVVTVDAGKTYTISELKTARYDLVDVMGVINIAMDGDVAIADLTEESYSEITFTNEIKKYDMFSHTDSVVNIITAGAKLTGITVDYKGPAVLDENTDGYDPGTKSYAFGPDDMTVTVHYDDGTVEILEWGEFSLDQPVVRSSGDTSVTVTAAYSSGGIKVKDSFSVDIDLPVSQRYTVTLDCAGGVVEPDGVWTTSGDNGFVESVSKTFWEGEIVSLPVNKPVRDKYVFAGWLGTDGITYKAGDVIAIGMDFGIVAQWRKVQDCTVKYAVRLYGINADVDEYGNTLGLTFGPASGTSYVATSVSHKPSDGQMCLHNMTWDEIIAQSKSGHPEVFQECLVNGCTHSVDLAMKGPIAGSNYGNKMRYGDGASGLFQSISAEYRKWNDSGNNGGWLQSKIRNTLNGTTTMYGSLTETDCLLAMFPEELRDGIVAKTVKSAKSADRSESGIAVTYDKLWLFSVAEMYRPSVSSYETYVNKHEGEMYFSQSSANYVFYDEDGRAVWVWSRSLQGSGNAVCFYSNGSPVYIGTGNSSGTVSFGFCLA